MITEAVTYDDVLVPPRFSTVKSRTNVILSSKLTNKITLKVPIISSNMDTITETKMAIEMAKIGGLGIIHRYCSIQEQVEMVKKVKRFTNYIIKNPYHININDTIENLILKMDKYNVKTILVTKNNIDDIKIEIKKDKEQEENKLLMGIVTHRDIEYYHASEKKIIKISEIMTPFDSLHCLYEDQLVEKDIENIIIRKMTENRVENLPIINRSNQLRGLITYRDLLYRRKYKNISNLDEKHQLCVGAAVGVKGDYLERALALHKAGCDIICIDVAHGHHVLCGDTVREIKKLIPDMEIIAGNVATGEGVKYLAKCGADCIKVGVGAGSICITRIQTGC